MKLIWMMQTGRGTRKIAMRNLKLILSYDGAEFSGWQVQPDATTVQGTLPRLLDGLREKRYCPKGPGALTRECMRWRRL